MIFIEPTPYILDLLEYGFPHHKNQLHIVFLTENLSQNWTLQPYSISFNILQSKKNYIRLLFDIFVKRKYKMIHLAGWSHLITIFLIFISRFFSLPVVVETDTPLNLDTPLWKKITKRILYPTLFKFPVFFLPGGTRQARYLNYYGVRDKKIIHAQMTVDTTRIRRYVKNINSHAREKLRSQYGVKQDDLIFLYVGRLLDWKGVRELILAIQLIQDVRAKLWIVGSGDLADETKLAAQEYKKIIYFGRISGDFLWEIYSSSDVCVLPSYAEPWGLVVNEAMAVGKPVIVTETVGCVDDLIVHSHEGIIITPKSVTALCEAMTFMLENPETRKAMEGNVVERIAGWTLENEANNMRTAWGKVCR